MSERQAFIQVSRSRRKKPPRLLRGSHRIGKFAAAWRRADRGSIAVEYVIALTFGGVMVAVALWQLTPDIVDEYGRRRALLYSQTP